MKKKFIVMLLVSFFVYVVFVFVRILYFGIFVIYVFYEFVDVDNKIVGFDIDVVNVVCKEM